MARNELDNTARKTLEDFLRDNSIECLDDVKGGLGRENKSLLDYIIKRREQYFKINEIKDFLVESGIFSSKIKNYNEEMQKKIIKKILDPFKGKISPSYYLNDRLDEEIKNENLQVVLKALNEKENIKHLDNINGKVAHNYPGLWKTIKVNRKKGNFKIGEIQNRLVELNVFSPRIKDYGKDFQESIIKRILNPPYLVFKPYYLCDFLNEATFKENFNLVWKSLAKKENIEHLEDINNKFIERYRTFWKNINVNKGSFNFKTLDVKNKLVELGIFSIRINDYPKRIKERIMNEGLKSKKGGGPNYYLEDSLDENIRNENLNLFLGRLIEKERITHLGDIYAKMGGKYQRFWNTLKVNREKIDFKVKEIQDRLGGLGVLSSKIRDYDEEIQERIISSILKPASSDYPYYFGNSINEKIKKDNIQTVLESAIKIDEIEHLDEIGKEMINKYRILWSALGIKRSLRKTKSFFRVENIRNRLVELGIFSPRINDYEKRIREKIIEKILHPKGSKTIYLNHSLREKIRNKNRKIVLEELLKREKIEMLNDIECNIRTKYIGFWKNSGVRKVGQVFLINNIKTHLLHLGYFNQDIEQDYEFITPTGTSTDLLKKLDSELFSYKVKFDNRQVDNITFKVLNKMYEEASKQGIELHNGLDVFEYYKRNYENDKR